MSLSLEVIKDVEDHIYCITDSPALDFQTKTEVSNDRSVYLVTIMDGESEGHS